MTHTITVTETLVKYIKVEADTEAEAIEEAAKRYWGCDFILTADDYEDTEFTVFK